MSDYICFLVTVFYESQQSLLKCAIWMKDTDVFGTDEYVWDAENKKKIHAMLPLHVRSCGPVVKVEPIFECAEAIQSAVPVV